jgi:ParB-like chromosome segregation protein Spo0J
MIKDKAQPRREELAKAQAARARANQGSSAPDVSSTGLATLDPKTIKVDPKRFQYKLIGEHTASGEVGSLSGVQKWDLNLGGVLQVWKDPADGGTYVVNGHNRLALAKRAGAQAVDARFLNVPNTKAARSVGALTNIAEGRGTALDAAKFFRDSGLTRSDLQSRGIPMREAIAQDGLNLSNLDDSIFRKTIDGNLSISRASIIGGAGLEPTQQRDLVKLIERDGKRRNLTDGAIAELADAAKASSTNSQQTMSLFGMEEVQQSNLIERAQLQASIKRRLAREKKLFGTVANASAAEDLGRAGNQINRESSGAISQQAAIALGTFDQLKNLSGPVSDALNAAATRVSKGESARAVERDAYQAVLEAVQSVYRPRSAAA